MAARRWSEARREFVAAHLYDEWRVENYKGGYRPMFHELSEMERRVWWRKACRLETALREIFREPK